MQSPGGPPVHGNNPGFLLAHTKMRLARLISRAFKERGHDLTPEHWGVMNMLRHCEGEHQTALAAHLGKDKPNLTRILDALEKKGLVTREPDPTDRRSQLPLLTDAGRVALTELEPVMTNIKTEVFGPIDPERYQVFLDVLGELMTRLDDLLTSSEPPAK